MADALSDDRLHAHLRTAWLRAEVVRLEARRIIAAGFPSAGLVWGVRAAEMLLRDFVLTPHFLEDGLDWDQAMEKGSKTLGASNWARAFAKVEEWYGPFDEPLTEDQRNAWKVWVRDAVDRRHGLVHGLAVHEATVEEAWSVVDFAEQMARWYALRFLATQRHPIGRQLPELLAEVRRMLERGDLAPG